MTALETERSEPTYHRYRRDEYHEFHVRRTVAPGITPTLQGHFHTSLGLWEFVRVAIISRDLLVYAIYLDPSYCELPPTDDLPFEFYHLAVRGSCQPIRFETANLSPLLLGCSFNFVIACYLSGQPQAFVCCMGVAFRRFN